MFISEREQAVQRALQCAREVTEEELNDIGIDRETFKEWMLAIAEDSFVKYPLEEMQADLKTLERLEREMG